MKINWIIPTAESVKKERKKQEDEKRRQDIKMNLDWIKRRIDDLIGCMDSKLTYKCGGISSDAEPFLNEKLSEYYDDAPNMTLKELLKEKGWELVNNGECYDLKGIK